MNPTGSWPGRRLPPALVQLHRSALPLIVVAVCLLFACAEGYVEERRRCGLVGCSSSLWIAVPADLPQGVWTIEIDVDDMSWTCTATVPLPTRDDAACTGVGVIPAIDDADRWHGAALHWAPEWVAVRLFHEGELVDEVSQAPEYDEYYPNGKACDRWPCRDGTVQLDFRGAK